CMKKCAQSVVQRRVLGGIGLVNALGNSALGEPSFVGDLGLSLFEAGVEVGRFPNRQQVPALGVEEEQQSVQQRQRRLEDIGQFLSRRRLALTETMLPVRKEALGQVRKEAEEDAVLQPVAQSLGVFPAAKQDVIEPAPVALGFRFEGDGSQ